MDSDSHLRFHRKKHNTVTIVKKETRVNKTQPHIVYIGNIGYTQTKYILRHTFDKIYLTSNVYIQRIQATLYNEYTEII